MMEQEHCNRPPDMPIELVFSMSISMHKHTSLQGYRSYLDYNLLRLCEHVCMHAVLV